MNIKSVQVQATSHSGAGIEVVSWKSPSATHWSIYLRMDDGTVEWQTDFSGAGGSIGRLFEEAVLAAALLSMKHQVPIERIK